MRIFFHPDYTVGPGVAPGQPQKVGRGLYRQWGITPRPEDFRYFFYKLILADQTSICKQKLHKTTSQGNTVKKEKR